MDNFVEYCCVANGEVVCCSTTPRDLIIMVECLEGVKVTPSNILVVVIDDSNISLYGKHTEISDKHLEEIKEHYKLAYNDKKPISVFIDKEE